MAKNAEDALLEERIQKIRQNNERIQRRHLEVEADKQVAAKSNALVQLSAPAFDDDPPYQPPKDIKKRVRNNREDNRQAEYAGNIGEREWNQRTNRRSTAAQFAEGDGPPPDPKFNFLADDLRDPIPITRGGQLPRGGRGDHGQYYRKDRDPTRENKNEFGRGRGRERGRSSGGPHQHAYEIWKTERHQIDQERINRQKTAGGEWRREWDKEKTSQSLESEWSHDTSQGNNTAWQDTQYTKPIRRSRNTVEAYIPKDTVLDVTQKTTSAGDGMETTGSTQRGRVTMRGRRTGSSTDQADTGIGFRGTRPTSNERIVLNVGSSLKVSVTNENVPVSRVKVTGRNVAGTGRVGPRQQARISYSSQSEDEAASRNDGGRKLPFKKHSKKPTVSSNVRAEAVSEKDVSSHASSETKETAASKPPRPPLSDFKGHEMPRPKRQRMKYTKQKSAQFQTEEKVDVGEKNDKKELIDNTKDRSESGDDGWEDVTTTSGAESVSEDFSPENEKTRNTRESSISDIGENETNVETSEKDAFNEIINERNESNLSTAGSAKQDSSNNPADDSKIYSNGTEEATKIMADVLNVVNAHVVAAKMETQELLHQTESSVKDCPQSVVGVNECETGTANKADNIAKDCSSETTILQEGITQDPLNLSQDAKDNQLCHNVEARDNS